MIHWPFDYTVTCRIEECLEGGQRYYRVRLVRRRNADFMSDPEIIGGWRRSIKRATASAFEELALSMRT